jgi:hypothetical protein
VTGRAGAKGSSIREQQAAAAATLSTPLRCAAASTLPRQKAIEAAAVLYDDYCRVITPENLLTEESEEVCAMLLQCMELRKVRGGG